MITLIIFSKDRAAQLDLLFQSLKKNAGHLFFDIRVLYTYSDKNFKKGYETLIGEWKEFATFVCEKSFNSDLKQIIATVDDYVCFMTDDDIFYQKADFRLKELLTVMKEIELGCFSFRLGKNTVNQYSTEEKSEIPNFLADYDNKFLIWNKDLIPNINFSYIFSVNGHVFRSTTIKHLFKAFDSDNPNHLESQLQKFRYFISPLIACLHESTLVNVPVNRVNKEVENIFGTQFLQAEEDLNDKYLSGKRIILNKIDFSKVEGTHQEFLLLME